MLDTRGVQIATLCVDSRAQIRAGRAKHGARAVMLAEESLAVTDLHSALGPRALARRAGRGVRLTDGTRSCLGN
jgi:hypothetical protein